MSEKQITWFQFNNIVPIVASALMIAYSFNTMTTKVEVIITRLDALVKSVEALNTTNRTIITELNDLENRMTVIETMHKK